MRRVVSRGLLCVSGVFLSTLVACNLVLGTGDLTERTADGGSDTGSDGARDATLDAEGDAPRDANCDAGLDGRLDAPADVCLGDPCDGESGASGPGIQFVRGESQTQTTTPASVSFVQNEGDLLVAGVYWEKSATSVTVSDNLVDEWVSVAPEENSVALGTVVQLWYATAGKAGPNMVTVTPSSSTTMGLFVLEYSGVSGLDVSSANKSNPASAGDVMIAGTVTTTEPRDLIVALFADSQGGT